MHFFDQLVAPGASLLFLKFEHVNIYALLVPSLVCKVCAYFNGFEKVCKSIHLRVNHRRDENVLVSTKLVLNYCVVCRFAFFLPGGARRGATIVSYTRIGNELHNLHTTIV